MRPNTVTELWTWWKGQPLIKATDERLNSSSRHPYPFQPHEQDFLKFPKLTEVRVTNFLVLNLVNGFQTPITECELAIFFQNLHCRAATKDPGAREDEVQLPHAAHFQLLNPIPFPHLHLCLVLQGTELVGALLRDASPASSRFTVAQVLLVLKCLSRKSYATDTTPYTFDIALEHSQASLKGLLALGSLVTAGVCKKG